jgi:DNA polymerase-4
MSRRILHADFNSFSPSGLLLDPTCGESVAVGKSRSAPRHILAKNELAKKFGVKTGDAIWQAKQSAVASHRQAGFCFLSEILRAGREIYGNTPTREAFGWTKNWIDVSGSTKRRRMRAARRDNSLSHSRRAGHYGFHWRCGQQGLCQARSVIKKPTRSP